MMIGDNNSYLNLTDVEFNNSDPIDVLDKLEKYIEEYDKTRNANLLPVIHRLFAKFVYSIMKENEVPIVTLKWNKIRVLYHNKRKLFFFVVWFDNINKPNVFVIKRSDITSKPLTEADIRRFYNNTLSFLAKKGYHARVDADVTIILIVNKYTENAIKINFDKAQVYVVTPTQLSDVREKLGKYFLSRAIGIAKSTIRSLKERKSIVNREELDKLKMIQTARKMFNVAVKLKKTLITTFTEVIDKILQGNDVDLIDENIDKYFNFDYVF